jgi:hypothetical protein
MADDTKMNKLRLLTRLSILWLILLGSQPLAGGHEPLPNEPEAPRRTIGRVFEKLRQGRTVTIAYLGGSALAGTGLPQAAAPKRTTLQGRVTDWFRSRFPGARLETIDAAIPGTGALYGTLRLRREVLSLKPDLVFIEFARHDATTDQRIVGKAVEGILRQLLVQAEPPEIVLLHSAAPDREVPITAAEEMARHYGIPSLDLRPGISAIHWSATGELNDAGHQEYSQRLISFLEEQQRRPATPIARRLPLPAISDELNYGEFRVLAEFIHHQNGGQNRNWQWKSRQSRDPRFPTRLAVSDDPGAMIETFFEGTVVGLTWEKGPDAGTIEVLIDGRPAPAPLGRIDGYDQLPGVGTAIVAGGLGLGEHRLTIRILPDRNPQSRGRKIRLGYLLIGGQRPEKL